MGGEEVGYFTLGRLSPNAAFFKQKEKSWHLELVLDLVTQLVIRSGFQANPELVSFDRKLNPEGLT